MLELIKEQMDKAREEGTTKTGFLIDGYPREKDQGILFEENVRLSPFFPYCLFHFKLSIYCCAQVCPVDLILFFDVANDTLKKRLLGRAAVSQRADDNEETINKRIEIFNAKNNEIVDYYKDKVVRVSSDMQYVHFFQLFRDHRISYKFI